jgi:Mce-associated membrane protein
MSASWYDVLDVDPTATTEEIRVAWRDAIATLDPTDRRFRVCSEAAEVLLDPARRAAYDAERAPVEPASSVEPVPSVEPVETTRGRGVRAIPGWVLVGPAGLVAGALVVAGVLVSKPSDAAVADDTRAAQAAADRAIVPVLSYDAHHLDRSAAVARPWLTSSYRRQYDKLFAVIRQNAPRTGTVVKATDVASGVVRSGTDRVDVLVFVDQATRNKQHPKDPIVYKNQVTVTMAKVGGRWLVDGLTTSTDSS